MHATYSSLKAFYDSLWQKAANTFVKGQVDIDPYLSDRQHDQRLGLSLIARPGKHVVQRISNMLQQLQYIEPSQYYYQPDELHITVLSLFTATEQYAQYVSKIPIYASVLQSVLSKIERFQVVFRGITASNTAIMVQGFPENDDLNHLREQLREALNAHGLGESLDKRYRIKTAHSTIMRFCTQPQNLSALLEILTAFREYDFGQTTFEALQWVKNDWYMSSDKVEVLEEYTLK